MSPPLVVYRGPSSLNGKPIFAALTLRSTNTKTGPMAVLNILPELHPVEAVRRGEDASVCGDCRFRPANAGGCYVQVPWGPAAVWRSAHAEPVRLVQAMVALDELEQLSLPTERVLLRLGAYGDPAALPASVVGRLVSAVAGRAIGYTHQWKQPRFRWLQKYCMASVESPRDALLADGMGWRTFRVFAGEPHLGPREVVCAYDSSGVSCQQCGLCRAELDAKHVAIQVHGHHQVRAAAAIEEARA